MRIELCEKYSRLYANERGEELTCPTQIWPITLNSCPLNLLFFPQMETAQALPLDVKHIICMIQSLWRSTSLLMTTGINSLVEFTVYAKFMSYHLKFFLLTMISCLVGSHHILYCSGMSLLFQFRISQSFLFTYAFSHDLITIRTPISSFTTTYCTTSYEV
jgi:hypothetical protein